MKRFKLIFLLSLTLLMILGTTSFGAVSLTMDEFEQFMACYGYNFDFQTATYTNSSASNLYTYYFSRNNYPLVVFDMNDGGILDTSALTSEQINSIDFVFYNANTSNAKTRQLLFSTDANGNSYYYFRYGSNCFAVDVETNTVYGSLDSIWYSNRNWYKKSEMSNSEFESDTYQKYLLQNYGLLYCETTLYSSNSTILLSNQGGKITQNTINNITYNGTLNYSPTTEICSINLTSGFESGKEYKIFLEEWTTTNDEEYGLLKYFDRVVWEENITSTTKEVNFYRNYFYNEVDQVYRICIGEIGTETNTIYLCTDWLIPNSNTIRLYPNFSTWHYMDFLNIVEYNPDEDIPTIPDTPSGDTGSGDTSGDTGGGTTTPSGDTGSGEITKEDITESITQGNENFWGNTNDIKEEDFENQIEDEINGIMDTMSGELTQNQIFRRITSSRKWVLKLFQGRT